MVAGRSAISGFDKGWRAAHRYFYQLLQ